MTKNLCQHKTTMLLSETSYFLCIISLLLVASQARGQLYTDSRWIVDRSGRRVKLACVNWPSHLQPVLAEGLDKQPVDHIMEMIKSMGFNCARFTWPVELATNHTLASLTVSQSFTALGLAETLANITVHNLWAINLTLIDAYKAMLERFHRHNVMVILDNHITVPGWCCSLTDGNGFFGDKFFDPNLWMEGLHKMATVATEFQSVIGMSLRNELRGPKSNVDDWYKYMQQGAETVHAANPNVLVILSGLNYDKELTFLRTRPVNVSFIRKIVYELHWYSFSNGGAWAGRNLNDACGEISGFYTGQAEFIADKGYGPMFLSEFGVNGRGDDVSDNRFISCFMAAAADQDWDFAVWTLQGSYYLRQGVVGMEELYGLLDYDWNNIRNLTLLNRLSSLQMPFQELGADQSSMCKVLFHPLTGQCVVKGSSEGTLQLGPCKDAEPWIYTSEGTMQLRGTKSFLQAMGAQKAIGLDTSPVSHWNTTSNSRLHLTAQARDKSTVCLDVDGEGNLVTNECKCQHGDKSCDPTSQWFKMVESTRP